LILITCPQNIYRGGEVRVQLRQVIVRDPSAGPKFPQLSTGFGIDGKSDVVMTFQGFQFIIGKASRELTVRRIPPELAFQGMNERYLPLDKSVSDRVHRVLGSASRLTLLGGSNECCDLEMPVS